MDKTKLCVVIDKNTQLLSAVTEMQSELPTAGFKSNRQTKQTATYLPSHDLPDMETFLKTMTDPKMSGPSLLMIVQIAHVIEIVTAKSINPLLFVSNIGLTYRDGVLGISSV
jgi:hypothetical protein